MKLLSALSIYLLSLFSGPVSSAQEILLLGSRSRALAGITASLADSYSIFGNQAGLALSPHGLTIGGSFENRYLIKELSANAGFLILPVHSSIFALSFYQWGQTSFRQQKVGLAFARNITPKFRFGLQFNYYTIFMAEENRSTGTSGLELGFQYQLSPKFLIGIHALNPYRVGISTISGEYPYPSIFNFGTQLLLSESFVLYTELQKSELYPLVFKSGIEYTIAKRLFIRTGITAKPYQLSTGLGMELKNIKIDLAMSYDQNLGNSPSVSFQYPIR